jgi:ECF sigma factor
LDAENQVTRLLLQWKHGDAGAIEMLTPLVYDELRRLAAHYLRDDSAAHRSGS